VVSKCKLLPFRRQYKISTHYSLPALHTRVSLRVFCSSMRHFTSLRQYHQLQSIHRSFLNNNKIGEPKPMSSRPRAVAVWHQHHAAPTTSRCSHQCVTSGSLIVDFMRLFRELNFPFLRWLFQPFVYISKCLPFVSQNLQFIQSPASALSLRHDTKQLASFATLRRGQSRQFSCRFSSCQQQRELGAKQL
jgi:hypothetical protein